MVTGIFIYVEGGGGKVADQRLRAGFEALLSELKEAARLRRMHFRVIPCGDGPRTCRDFGIGVLSEADALNVLLIDSDGPVKDGRRTHMLALWNVPLPDLPDDHFHLMVEAMESWLVADPDTLARYYGSGFHARRLPRDPRRSRCLRRLTRRRSVRPPPTATASSLRSRPLSRARRGELPLAPT